MPVTHHESIDAFHFDEGEGIHTIKIGSWKLPIYFRHQPGPLLIVGFHGALHRPSIILPRFEGMQASPNWPGSVLLIADPTLDLSEQLSIAWYVGTTMFNLEEYLVRLVQQIMGQCNASKLMFTGGSGGGFRAMMISHHFPESLAYVFNPQLNILQYNPYSVSMFLDTCFPGEDPTAPQHLSRLNCMHRYQDGHPNYVYYLNNASDDYHIQTYLEPFAARFGINPAGGTSSDGKIKIIIQDFAQGHRGPPLPIYHDHQKKALALIGL